MEKVKLSAKGQIVIPARIRKELGLSEGDRLFIERRQGEVIYKTCGETVGVKRDRQIRRSIQRD